MDGQDYPVELVGREIQRHISKNSWGALSRHLGGTFDLVVTGPRLRR
jgi:hypothetical protein